MCLSGLTTLGSGLPRGTPSLPCALAFSCRAAAANGEGLARADGGPLVSALQLPWLLLRLLLTLVNESSSSSAANDPAAERSSETVLSPGSAAAGAASASRSAGRSAPRPIISGLSFRPPANSGPFCSVLSPPSPLLIQQTVSWLLPLSVLLGATHEEVSVLTARAELSLGV